MDRADELAALVRERFGDVASLEREGPERTQQRLAEDRAYDRREALREQR